MRIGCHLSVSRGFAKLVERAREVGADVVQYFPKNPKSYRPKAFNPDQLRAEAAAADGMLSVAHSPYVTNLSANKPDLREITVASIINDLEIADAYGTAYLVVHCGKHVGEGEAAGVQAMVETLDRILEGFSGSTMLLLENTAGQGSELGQTREQLLEIHSRLSVPERVGFCIDTCHAFASGWMDPDRWEEFVADLTRPDFLPLVKVIHLNDSKAGPGARLDRHELLGRGAIGAEGLRRFLTEPALRHLPVIIETPVEDELEYADEIRLARQWAAER